MEEIWKPIIDYPNYSVSSFGNVRNDVTGLMLKGCFNTNKYLMVKLSKNNKKKTFKIHRLVGLAFIENPENKKQIDHIDNDRTNNNINNLRWATNEENGRNKPKKQGTSSVYKGVSFYKKTNKWEVSISINKKKTHLGYFETEVEAGLAYNNYIIQNDLREFFVLNNIN